MNYTALRRGQYGAVDVVTRRITSGEQFTSIVLPTRYGKSDVMRATSVLLVRDKKISCALTLSPSRGLARQMGSDEKWQAMFNRLELDSAGIHYRTFTTMPKSWRGGTPDFVPNGEVFVSCTIQFALYYIDLFAQWVDHMFHKTKLPVLVNIDECHMGAEGADWGELPVALVRSGAQAVLYTATAMRSDGKLIPGFRTKLVDAKPVIIHKTKTSGDEEERICVEVYEGFRQLVKLEADHETTFRDAWNENPSPLCKMSRVTLDVELRKINGLAGDVVEGLKLSELSEKDTRRVLGKVVRAPGVIRDAVSTLIRHWRQLKKTQPDVAFIIFCCNDFAGGEANEHAKAIREAIRSQDKTIVADIATSSLDDSDEYFPTQSQSDPADELIERLVNGAGDGLIVKMKAGVGLDASRIKLVLDLSNVRTPAAVIQRWNRATTPHNGMQHAIAIMPDDILSRAGWQEFIAGQGGEFGVSDLTKIAEYEKPKTEDSEKPSWQITGTMAGSLFDTNDNRAGQDAYESASRLIEVFPVLAEKYTLPEIDAGLRDIAAGGSSRQEGHKNSSNTDDLMEEMYEYIKGCAKVVAAILQRNKRYKKEDAPQMMKDIYGAFFRKADIPKGTKLRDITNLEALERVRAAAIEVRDHVDRTQGLSE